MARPGRGGPLDGGWWPRRRDLSVELADLVDGLPAELGTVVRASCSRPDWDPVPPRIRVAHGYVEVASFLPDDTHLIVLETEDRRALRLLVVPPDLSADQGEEALLAAATPGYAHTPASLLSTVTEWPDVDPRDFWSDDAPLLRG